MVRINPVPPPVFVDNPVVHGREDHYTEIQVRVPAVLESWRLSLYSYEWLRPDGTIKAANELPPAEQELRTLVEDTLRARLAVEKPILGIGLLDNVEIGSGRAVFLTLAALGHTTMPVYIPKSHEAEFDPFKA